MQTVWVRWIWYRRPLHLDSCSANWSDWKQNCIEGKVHPAVKIQSLSLPWIEKTLFTFSVFTELLHRPQTLWMLTALALQQQWRFWLKIGYRKCLFIYVLRLGAAVRRGVCFYYVITFSHFKTSPRLPQLFRRSAAALFCREGPDMFRGLWNFASSIRVSR